MHFITGYVQILGAMLSFEFKLIYVTRTKLEMKFYLYSAKDLAQQVAVILSASV